MSAHAAKLPVCPNCATDLSQGENFCPTCGQPNHDVNVTFGHVLEETLEGVFHFDSKVWLTFRELVFQPGKLTVDFLAGRRARFVPPIRLYVFLSFVFFFLLNRNPDAVNFTFGDTTEKEASANSAQPTPADSTHREMQGVHVGKGGLNVQYGRQKLHFSAATMGNKMLLGRLAAGNLSATDSLLAAQHVAPTWLNRLAVKRIARTALATEEEKAHAFLRNLSVGMFVLMPLFALLMKLFYRRQRPLYVQHLMFSVHLHSFFFLLFSVALLLSYLLPTGWTLAPVVLVASWLYWVVALRRFSDQSWARTLWKSAFLFGGYVGLLSVFVIGLVVVLLALL